MKTDPDADLRDWFRGLRQADCAAAPAFESLVSRVPRKVPLGRGWAWLAGGLALVAAAGFFLTLRPPASEVDVAALSLPAWHSPTESLLARAGDSIQGLSQAHSPTSALGRPSFSRYEENR